MAVITVLSRQSEPAASDRVPVYPDGAVAITPSDTDTFSAPVNIYVGGAGVVTCTPALNGIAGATVAVTVPAGGYVPFRAVKVMSTGTTATLLVAVY